MFFPQKDMQDAAERIRAAAESTPESRTDFGLQDK